MASQQVLNLLHLRFIWRLWESGQFLVQRWAEGIKGPGNVSVRPTHVASSL